MTARTNKPAGLQWLQGAFGTFFPLGDEHGCDCLNSLRYHFDLEAWYMIKSANKQTQRMIFGATIGELMDSDCAGLSDWQANPMHGHLEPIGRFAIALNDAGKKRLLQFIADRRECGDSWHDIAERCGQLRQNNAGDFQTRGSSRALILKIAARLMEAGAAK